MMQFSPCEAGGVLLKLVVLWITTDVSATESDFCAMLKKTLKNTGDVRVLPPLSLSSQMLLTRTAGFSLWCGRNGTIVAARYSTTARESLELVVQFSIDLLGMVVALWLSPYSCHTVQPMTWLAVIALPVPSQRYM
ncbi:uncharacterized protein HD556DRAFT_944710 [Suillus plorans]|uniref:Uncharacterized protein n=1 Tax=Suillus plorans TaxID=116603 RepID=A0A9P7DBU4_9AGAM|nr:uncharacterized protein HD556DRAFT_944710 [Suillus plorans]KAG1787690.1 hypothetical protein HD556DRAFT_944710 [Suillus plorans]